MQGNINHGMKNFRQKGGCHAPTKWPRPAKRYGKIPPPTHSVEAERKNYGAEKNGHNTVIMKDRKPIALRMQGRGRIPETAVGILGIEQWECAFAMTRYG